MHLVDARVGSFEVEDRLHLHRLTVGGIHHHDGVALIVLERPVLAVFAQQFGGGSRAVPLDVDPHPAPLRIAGDQLVAGQVRDARRVGGGGGDLQRGRVLEVVLGARDARVQAGDLLGAEPAAQDQSPLPVQVLDDGGHPIVAARQVVAGQVVPDGNTVLVAPQPRRRSHVTGLAAEVARGAVRVIAAGPGDDRAGVGLGDGPGLDVDRKCRVVANPRLDQHAGLRLAESPLDDAVRVGGVVEGGLVFDVTEEAAAV